MASPDSWVHFTPNILSCGRLAHLDPEPPEGSDIDPEVLKKQLEASDPYERRLKPISADERVKGNLPAWVIRYCGDKNTYA